MTRGIQSLCDAVVDSCSGQGLAADRAAAALVLLAAVDDDVAVDPDNMPPALRALLDADA